MNRQVSKFCIRQHDVVLGAWVVLSLLHRYTPVDVSSLWQPVLWVACYMGMRLGALRGRNFLLTGVWGWGIFEAGLACLQHVHWAESNHPYFEVTGTFGNPAPLGGLLSICLVVSVWLFLKWRQRNNRWSVGAVCLVTIGMGYALYLTQSRAAWVAVAAGLLWLWLYGRERKQLSAGRSALAKAMGVLLLLAACGSLYFLKKDSADGRLLVWRNTVDMIVERPWAGWGNGGWDARYMHYQADYFTRHPDSAYTMLADNVGYPYNEFLYIAADYGLVGLLLIFALLYALYTYRDETGHGLLYKALLTVFLAFSLFSYPLSVFPLQLLLAALLGSMKSRRLACFSVCVWKFRVVVACLAIGMSAVALASYTVYRTAKAGREWQRLYPYFRYNAELMNRYAQTCVDEPLETRREILEDVIALAPTCELYMERGDLWRRQGNLAKAEACYRWAAAMIPHRLTPKFKLFELYRDKDDRGRALPMAVAIVNAPVKKEGTKVLRMKAEARRFFRR